MAHALHALFNAHQAVEIGNGEDKMKRPDKEAKALVGDRRSIALNVNGKPYKLAVGTMHGAVAPSDTLLHTIRETLGLKGGLRPGRLRRLHGHYGWQADSILYDPYCGM
jgi:hypothetical protein